MPKHDISNFLLVKSPLKYFPLAPLGLWYDTNKGLDNYYKTKGITDNTQQEIDLKNSMRHITGLARVSQAYNPTFAAMLQYAKEAGDFWGNGDLQDNLVDLHNNNLGIEFARNNPKATRQEIMDYAYQKALEEHDALYKTIINQDNNANDKKSIYNNSNDVYFEPKRTLYNQLTK